MKLVYNIPDKIEKCKTCQIGNKKKKKPLSEYAKPRKIRLYVFNRDTLKWISMSSSIKHNLARLIVQQPVIERFDWIKIS